MDALTITLIVVLVLGLLWVVFALWFWRGVWLVQNRGLPYASTRWHYFVMAGRMIERNKIQREIRQGKRPPSVVLVVDKATHGQRAQLIKTHEIERRDTTNGKNAE